MENLRNIDSLGRWGGDEFIIVFPKTNINEAKTILECMHRKVISKIKTIVAESSFCYGYAEYSCVDTSYVDVFNRADTVLYANKERYKETLNQ